MHPHNVVLRQHQAIANEDALDAHWLIESLIVDENEFLRRLSRIESLVQSIETRADPLLRDNAKELLQAVLDLHRVGLTKLLGLIQVAPGGAGRAILDECSEDELVRSLLLLHGLHPRDLESRILTALETVRPFLDEQQSGVELLDVARGVIRLQLHTNGNGTPLLMKAICDTIEAAVWAGAPDATDVKIEVADTKAGARNQRIALPLAGGHR